MGRGWGRGRGIGRRQRGDRAATHSGKGEVQSRVAVMESRGAYRSKRHESRWRMSVEALCRIFKAQSGQVIGNING